MTTLIFLLTVLSLLVLLIILLTKAISSKPFKQLLKSIAIILFGYFTIWLVFYLTAKPLVVPLGTDVCFDDWCASITQIEKSTEIQSQFLSAGKDSVWIILHVRMSNHARGIAQKPSEPRIHILDSDGNKFGYSPKGQILLQRLSGRQINIGQRLELNQSIETKLVCSVPRKSVGLKVLIEEGPFITHLLFPEDYSVFVVQ